jgi:uncharacterized membrane protein
MQRMVGEKVGKLSSVELKVVRYLAGRVHVYRSQIRDDLGLPEGKFCKVLLSLEEIGVIGRYRPRGKWSEPQYYITSGTQVEL